MSNTALPRRTKVGILGTGNIGTDLLMKVRKSDVLTCGIFAGRNLESKGMLLARKLGVQVTDESINYIVDHPDCCDIVFDATTANAHKQNAPILKALKKFAIDLTPAHVGPFCIPVLNAAELMQAENVNMITCGGQATVPIAYAIAKAQPDIRYIEMVATISSKSAGPGTRENIDEFTQTTSDALKQFTGMNHAKAIIILNPAEPPITMRNTIYALVNNPDMAAITAAVNDMTRRIQAYVPGFRLVLPPVYENGRLSVSVSVVGSGDFLPAYAGNLDIITCAAVSLAQMRARYLQTGRIGQ